MLYRIRLSLPKAGSLFLAAIKPLYPRGHADKKPVISCSNVKIRGLCALTEEENG